MRYYFIETQVTEPDATTGKSDINLVTKEFYTFPSALSHFYSQRAAHLVLNEGDGYSAFHTRLYDEEMHLKATFDIPKIPVEDDGTVIPE